MNLPKSHLTISISFQKNVNIPEKRKYEGRGIGIEGEILKKWPKSSPTITAVMGAM
jgi:hypothetical protein